jgi:hypothetical protein
MSLSPALLRSIICNLWEVYGKTDEDLKLRDAFVSMTETLHPFWVMKHLSQQCDYHNWNFVIGIATDPKLYYQYLNNDMIHLYDKGFII